MAVSVISHSISRFVLAISLFVLCLSYCFSSTEAQIGGFSVELIHRDSPKSPFFNPKEDPFERIKNALRRSFNRVKLIDPNFASPTSPQADIIPNEGAFLINISLGTPPVEILAIADTGSDLIWTQCTPCFLCYKQDAPLFNSSASTTYEDVTCSSNQCRSMNGTYCSIFGSMCNYLVSYGDNSYSNGNLAMDTITLASTSGQPVRFPKTIVGCGHANGGSFSPQTSGIVGLGGGNVSLVSQMGPSINGKFSYCLVPLFSEAAAATSSRIHFGINAVVSGAGVVSTPLIGNDPKTFYFLTLEAVTVGNQRITADSSSFRTTEGNIIIDSGTTLTYLPKVFNSKIVKAVSSLINAIPVADPEGVFDLCYNSANSKFWFPEITVHFTGADVKLSPLNTFVKISNEIVCLIFTGVDGGPPIYGNLMQQNFLVGYDTQQRSVSFKPTDCTKQ